MEEIEKRNASLFQGDTNEGNTAFYVFVFSLTKYRSIKRVAIYIVQNL